MLMNQRDGGTLPTVEPNGATARVFLAFLATAGLFYVKDRKSVV